VLNEHGREVCQVVLLNPFEAAVELRGKVLFDAPHVTQAARLLIYKLLLLLLELVTLSLLAGCPALVDLLLDLLYLIVIDRFGH